MLPFVIAPRGSRVASDCDEFRRKIVSDIGNLGAGRRPARTPQLQGKPMARERKGPPEQAKHFAHDDHEHAAHQQEAAHAPPTKPQSQAKGSTGSRAGKPGHPGDTAPRGPRRGQ
jgi:hypothetical protein